MEVELQSARMEADLPRAAPGTVSKRQRSPVRAEESFGWRSVGSLMSTVGLSKRESREPLLPLTEPSADARVDTGRAAKGKGSWRVVTILYVVGLHVLLLVNAAQHLHGCEHGRPR